MPWSWISRLCGCRPTTKKPDIAVVNRRAHDVQVRDLCAGTRRALACGMRFVLLLMMALAGCGSDSNMEGPDMAMCHGPLDNNVNLPNCCPGICWQDYCCDPDCYGPLVQGKCKPGTVCSYDAVGGPLHGTFTCGADGKLQGVDHDLGI